MPVRHAYSVDKDPWKCNIERYVLQIRWVLQNLLQPLHDPGKWGIIPLHGRIAQLVRALPLQGRGRWFESNCAHYLNPGEPWVFIMGHGVTEWSFEIQNLPGDTKCHTESNCALTLKAAFCLRENGTTVIFDNLPVLQSFKE